MIGIAVAAALVAATTILGPASDARALGPAGVPLGKTPPAVRAFCRQRAERHKFLVMCPTRYPMMSTSDVVGSGASLLGPSFYWASFNDAAGFDDGDDGHLILGAQRPPFSLVGAPGSTWPRPGQPRPLDQLALPRLQTTPIQGGGRYVEQRPARILSRTHVRRHSGLVLVAPSYPTGGFMGGHVVVIWNADGHGYMLSFHFDGARNGHVYSQAERVTAALAVARSYEPVPA
jgi:hypothetical protein